MSPAQEYGYNLRDFLNSNLHQMDNHDLLFAMWWKLTFSDRRVSRKEIQQKWPVECSTRTIQRYIAALVQEDIVELRGESIYRTYKIMV